MAIPYPPLSQGQALQKNDNYTQNFIPAELVSVKLVLAKFVHVKTESGKQESTLSFCHSCGSRNPFSAITRL